MKLTILGKSPAWEDAGGACSGYLVEQREARVLIDCGNGVFGKLRALLDDWTAVDGVVVSHVHADHVLDLVPFAYALQSSPRRRRAAAPPPQLHLPPGATAQLRALTEVWGSEGLIESSFRVREYDPGAGLAIGPLGFSFAEVPHYALTHAVDLRDEQGGRLTYGADCAPSAALASLARATPLLIAEATLPEPDPSDPRPPGHMTPAQAGALAREARAQRLLLTHISDELDLDRARAEAAESFGGPTSVAREGQSFEL